MNYDPYQAPVAASVPPPIPFGGQVSEHAAQELIGTQAWVRFASVLMLIATCFLFLSLLMGLLSPANPGLNDPAFRTGDAAYRGGYMAGQLLGFFFVGMLYLYPAILLSKYASAIRRFRHGRSMSDFEAALRHQRFFWRFVGIVSSIILMLLLIVVAAGAGSILYR